MLFSCSTDFSQQIAQVVLFLFLGRPCVLMRTGNCVLFSRGCAWRKMAGMKGVSDDDIARWIFEDSEVEG
jgi:G:T-mismatch repair DNA endonuclease (very short patch repair protein)